MVPGGDGTCDKPLLYYARKATLLSGCDKVSNLFLTPTVNTIPHIMNSICTVVVGTNVSGK